MNGFFYVAVLIYAILAVLGAAFLICILPSLITEMIDFLSRVPSSIKQMLHPSNNELVERLLLMIEELREWRQVPGKHRSTAHGVYSPDEMFFTDLIEKWTNVDDHISAKELVNA